VKQLGILLILLGIWTASRLFFNLTSPFWDALSFVVWLLTLFLTPNIKQIIEQKLHWRIVIAIAAFSGFLLVWLSIQFVLPTPTRQYAFSIALLLLGIVLQFAHFVKKAQSSTSQNK
jgi:hypothetical protein